MEETIITLFLLLLSLNASDTFNIDTNRKVHFQKDNGILFGQNVIQYSHGILVSSPLYTSDNRHYGKIENCNPKTKLCEHIILKEDKKSRIRSGFAMAANLLHSQFLLCQQHRKRPHKNSENLNGVCTFLSSELKETSSFDTASLVESSVGNNDNSKLERLEEFARKDKLITAKNNNNNNNNKEDSEFSEMEIAFVLDGSGSIDALDFTRTKNLIINLMKNVWKQCLQCEFALVQYGEEIKTIFDLKDSREMNSRIFSIVKNMPQLGKVTKTASAIQHVLDNIFNETQSSNKNAKRVIIVVTDGEIFRDERNLMDIVNSSKMVNVTRIAIGVDNYAALDGLLASLETHIVGIEVAAEVSAGNNSNNNNNSGNNDRNKDWEEEKAKQSNKNSNNNNELEEEDDEFPGTEIAIVLDGSGSIDAADFQKAKDFVISITKNIWKRCLECEFALVQYGEEIKTIFDLKDSQQMSSGIFSIVRNMSQLCKVTKTASAMQHVLDNIFNETQGSRKNAKRFIIVVTDGEIFRDERNLTDVVNSSKMVNVTRIAVGVGSIFTRQGAMNELKLIASDPDEKYVFQVDNYAALDGLLASLEKNIVGIEGTQGTNVSAFQMELAQVGFSAHYSADGNILLGAVGAYDWSGGVIMYNQATGAQFLNESKGTLEAAYGYLGYSVATIKGASGQHLYIAGAPQHSLTGRVLVFQAGTPVKIKQRLAGKQLGSYFGSELCSIDVNNDSVTDYLLVGAPFFHVQGEEGMVYVYRLNDKNTFEDKESLTGISSITNARFGVAISNIGDINMDGYNDVAIGAPLEEDHGGSVYIFNGYRDGIHKTHSQRIRGKDVMLGLQYFGQSIAGTSDMDADGLLDITVSALDNVVVLSSRPVINIGVNVTFFPKMVPLSFTATSGLEKIFQASVCFTTQSKFASLDLKNSFVNYTINLDTKQESKRVKFAKNDATPNSLSDFVRISSDVCKNYSLVVQRCTIDCISAIIVEVNYTLNNTEEKARLPSPILDHFTKPSTHFEIEFQKNCGSDNICNAKLDLASNLPQNFTWIVGKTKEVSLKIDLSNIGEDSYLTTMVLSYPKSFYFKGISKTLLGDVKCTDLETTSSLSFLSCEISHPVFKNASQVNFSISWDLETAPFKEEFASVSINVSNKNGVGGAVHATHNITVRHGLNVFLKAENQITKIDISNDVDETVKINFQVNMDNPYNASVNLTVSIPVKIQNRQILTLQQGTLKHCKKIQKTLEMQPAQKGTDQWVCYMEGCECWHFACTLTEAKQDIDLTTKLSLSNLKQLVKNKADIVVLGAVEFDKTLYQETSNAEDVRHKIKVHVNIVNTPVFNAIPVVAGSSVGGILLLLLLIILLYKCGFFKRNYKDMIEFEEETEQ
ncbi:integrin alpha-E-like isoform X2 [Carcharodon carcharias]|uniref:integrin alpha-E-like isoform X2 n=1 Tax=Carcharodon carcharias TaxID=13397 RepID=UPI001B7E5609|nr:integrin alpha-E-like isoform X2 [Carcharodon carcharias]